MQGYNNTIFEDGYDLIPDGVNANIGTGGANFTGIWVSLKNWDRAYCVIIQPAGSEGDDIVITPLQATAQAGTGSKALTFSRFWLKALAAVNTVPQWSMYDLTTPSSALNTASITGNLTTVNGQAPAAVAASDILTDTLQNIIVVEIRADSLDINNGFNYVSMTIPKVTIAASRIINSHWELKGNAYPQAIPLSSIA